MSENGKSIENHVTRIEIDEYNTMDVVKKVLGDGKKENVTVTLGRKRIMPERMESPARAHVFHDADGFVSYVDANKTDNTLVLATVDDSRVFAVLDDRAEEGFERIYLIPAKDPRFVLLEKSLLQQRMSIESFAIAVMRNREIIQDTDKLSARDLALAMQQITVSEKIENCSGIGATSVNGVMCTSTVKAGQAEAKIDIPDILTVKVPIYLNTEAVEFDIDITVLNQRGAVMAVVDSPQLEVRRFEVFENQILAPIKEMDDVDVSYGYPATEVWEYNK